MVEETTLSRKIDVRLRTVRGRLDALPLHGEAGEGDAALDAEWHDALDRFDWLHERFVRGELSADQSARHRRNLDLLAERLSLLERLRLAVPRGALATWLAEHPTAGSLAEPT